MIINVNLHIPFLQSVTMVKGYFPAEHSTDRESTVQCIFLDRYMQMKTQNIIFICQTEPEQAKTEPMSHLNIYNTHLE